MPPQVQDCDWSERLSIKYACHTKGQEVVEMGVLYCFFSLSILWLCDFCSTEGLLVMCRGDVSVFHTAGFQQILAFAV